MIFWWRDIIKEGLSGNHTISFLKFLQNGVILFILSEVVFFGSFFWGFFHMCWSSKEELGFVWPPYDFFLIIIDPFRVPLLKTILLLSSGITVTAAHHFILVKKYKLRISYLLFTIVLGIIFLILQVEEYVKSYIRFKSSVYGSIFFILTGFHGLHVTIGVIALSVILIRLINKGLSKFDHLGFESAAWYWHFVDVVWLFLFIFIYWLGSPL